MCNVLNTEFKAEWTYNFYSTGIFTILVGVLIILFLNDHPDTVKSKLFFILQENPLIKEN